ncbi:hypothetical protein BDR06DRAFT_950158, partial [Suillus hirtellus]
MMVESTCLTLERPHPAKVSCVSFACDQMMCTWQIMKTHPIGSRYGCNNYTKYIALVSDV